MKIEIYPLWPSLVLDMPIWKKHPFVAFGLPFITAVLVGFAVLTEVRTVRYSRPRNARLEEVAKESKRSLKSLEDELQVHERGPLP